jgi:hypothetical protein
MNNSAVLALWGRLLAIVAGFVFVISLAFPVVAGLSKDTRSFQNCGAFWILPLLLS